MPEPMRSIRRRRVRARPTQEQFVFPNGWGGRRKGSGPKRRGERANVSHRNRVAFADRIPVEVTLRVKAGLPSLRGLREFAALRGAMRAGVRARWVSARPLQRSIESHAPDRRGRLSTHPCARPSGSIDPHGSRVESTVEPHRECVRRPLPRSHPAIAEGGVDRSALRALQRAQAWRVDFAHAPRSILFGALVRGLARRAAEA